LFDWPKAKVGFGLFGSFWLLRNASDVRYWHERGWEQYT